MWAALVPRARSPPFWSSGQGRPPLWWQRPGHILPCLPWVCCSSWVHFRGLLLSFCRTLLLDSLQKESRHTWHSLSWSDLLNIWGQDGGSPGGEAASLPSSSHNPPPPGGQIALDFFKFKFTFFSIWLHQIFSCDMEDLVPWPRIKPGILHWDHRILSSGPPGKSQIAPDYLKCKGPYSQNHIFSSSHIWMWELDHKEGWVLKNWCFWTVVLEKTLESPLDSKEIKPVNLKGNKPWIFIGRSWSSKTSATWWEKPTHWKRPWCWERLREGGEGGNRGWDGWMASLVHWTWVWANSRRQWRTGNLMCCIPWNCKESDTTYWLNNNNQTCLGPSSHSPSKQLNRISPEQMESSYWGEFQWIKFSPLQAYLVVWRKKRELTYFDSREQT